MVSDSDFKGSAPKPAPQSADDVAAMQPKAPPPRPVRPPPIARPKETSGLFAPLPELPKMAVGAPKRNLTLVGMLQGKQAAGPSRLRAVLWAAGLLVLVAIVASVLYRRTLVSRFVPKHVASPAQKEVLKEPVLTLGQQAARALAAGSEAYSHRDYGKAVASFEEALNLDPSLADAHRSLGIVHADLHDEAEAIAHYQKYIEMVPNGRDSARVKKIIDDYNIAHAPPPPALPSPPVKNAGKGQGRAHKANKGSKH